MADPKDIKFLRDYGLRPNESVAEAYLALSDERRAEIRQRGLEPGSRAYNKQLDTYRTEDANKKGQNEERARVQEQIGRMLQGQPPEVQARLGSLDSVEKVSEGLKTYAEEQHQKKLNSEWTRLGLATGGTLGSIPIGYAVNKYASGQQTETINKRNNALMQSAQNAWGVDPKSPNALNDYEAIRGAANEKRLGKTPRPWGGIGATLLPLTAAGISLNNLAKSEDPEVSNIYMGQSILEGLAGLHLGWDTAHRYDNPKAQYDQNALAALTRMNAMKTREDAAGGAVDPVEGQLRRDQRLQAIRDEINGNARAAEEARKAQAAAEAQASMQRAQEMAQNAVRTQQGGITPPNENALRTGQTTAPAPEPDMAYRQWLAEEQARRTAAMNTQQQPQQPTPPQAPPRQPQQNNLLPPPQPPETPQQTATPPVPPEQPAQPPRQTLPPGPNGGENIADLQRQLQEALARPTRSPEDLALIDTLQGKLAEQNLRARNLQSSLEEAQAQQQKLLDAAANRTDSDARRAYTGAGTRGEKRLTAAAPDDLLRVAQTIDPSATPETALGLVRGENSRLAALSPDALRTEAKAAGIATEGMTNARLLTALMKAKTFGIPLAIGAGAAALSGGETRAGPRADESTGHYVARSVGDTAANLAPYFVPGAGEALTGSELGSAVGDALNRPQSVMPQGPMDRMRSLMASEPQRRLSDARDADAAAGDFMAPGGPRELAQSRANANLRQAIAADRDQRREAFYGAGGTGELNPSPDDRSQGRAAFEQALQEMADAFRAHFHHRDGPQQPQSSNALMGP
jgi:hypothetical protein